MRYFVYEEPNDPLNNDFTSRSVTVSEDDIMKAYWPYWKEQMIKKGHEPTKDKCIEDFCIIHWAWEI